MKVFVATKEKQGQRQSDFFWTNEGELVTFGVVCGSGKCDDIDGGCGCQRSMIGLKTRKGTTTVKVVSKRTFTQDDLVQSLLISHCNAYRSKQDDPETIEYAKAQAAELSRLANGFKIGDVIEIRGEKLKVRK
jgi:hypothetical protein